MSCKETPVPGNSRREPQVVDKTKRRKSWAEKRRRYFKYVNFYIIDESYPKRSIYWDNWEHEIMFLFYRIY